LSARRFRLGLWSAVSLQPDSSLPATVVTPPDTSTSPSQSVADQRPLTTSSANAATTTVNVRGYFRKDGTYVAAHKRTAPDGNFNNNWSTQGNVNPYTGEAGTKRQSGWLTALKWIGVGAALGALLYLDAKYPSGTATARCKDGTYSYSLHRQGTCSWHGGVAYWLR